MISPALHDSDEVIEVARKKVSETIKNDLLTDDQGPSHFRAEFVLLTNVHGRQLRAAYWGPSFGITAS